MSNDAQVSDAYTTDDIKYEWKASNPIQLKEGLRKSLPSFELQEVKTDYCTSKTNTGESHTADSLTLSAWSAAGAYPFAGAEISVYLHAPFCMSD